MFTFDINYFILKASVKVFFLFKIFYYFLTIKMLYCLCSNIFKYS